MMSSINSNNGDEETGSNNSDPFVDTCNTKNVSIESLKRWRQAAMTLNASRRFKYTLDLKKEEEKNQRRRMIIAHAQAIRAASLFRLAGEEVALLGNQMKKPESDLWKDGLVCAWECFQGLGKSFEYTQHTDGATYGVTGGLSGSASYVESGNHWVPIGWDRIEDLMKTKQDNSSGASQQFDSIWWCHVAAGDQFIDEWLNNAEWLAPEISIALRDKDQWISEKNNYLLYEVPVRVAGGLLFELPGQSAGEPLDEGNIPIVLRCWQAKNFLITALHVKRPAKRINVLGITDVQKFLLGGSYDAPRTIHEVIALLAHHLALWDDRLFRKSTFGVADYVELKFLNRRNVKDIYDFSIILDQEIREILGQVVRAISLLQARQDIVLELLQHLRGDAANSLLKGVTKRTREMIEGQVAVRGRMYTIQGCMQSTIHVWKQDRNLRVTHNLAVLGACGLVLSIIIGLCGIYVDGMPKANSPGAFILLVFILFFLGLLLGAGGLYYCGFKAITEEQASPKESQLQDLV